MQQILHAAHLPVHNYQTILRSQQDLWRQQQGCTAALASHPISVPAEVSPLQPAPRAEGKPGKRGKRRSEADDLLAEVRI